MPYYVASVNIVVKAPDAESANEHLGCSLSSFPFRKSDEYGILDWQYRQVGAGYATPKPIKIPSPFNPEVGFEVREW